jgi:hypothetical protein
LHGIQHGALIFIPPTGTHGNHFSGIIIMGTITTGIMIITVITAAGTHTGIQAGTTSITPTDGHIPQM